MTHTKWSVLTGRLAALEAQAAKLREELTGLDATPFGGECGGCDVHLATEGDFARHFIVLDLRYLNLGGCPDRPDTYVLWGTNPRYASGVPIKIMSGSYRECEAAHDERSVDPAWELEIRVDATDS